MGYNKHMKIICERCGEDISRLVSDQFEKNMVGQIECPKCHNKQKRYLSEADITTYMTFTQGLYFLLTFITTLTFDTMGLTITTGVTVVGMLVIAGYGTGKFKELIYTKSIGKKETMNIVMDEDAEKISKAMRWQFLLFFALVITFFTSENVYWVFVALSVAVLIINSIKVRLIIKKEKEKYLK